MKKIKFHIPQLRLWQRISLYIVTILCAALALYQVGTEQFHMILAIPIYVLAGVTFFVGVTYFVIDMVHLSRRKKESRISNNRHIARLQLDEHLKVVLFSVPAVMSNVIFALFHAIMGIYSQSPWFGTLAAYYILLSMMRISVVEKERKTRIKFQGQRVNREEVKVYQNTSWLIILMAIVLGGMVILLIHSAGGKQYPGELIYIVALFTFYKIIASTINVLKARKKNLPLLSALRRIGHVDACVSILTLQTAMFASFGQGQQDLTKMMNGLTGVGVCLIVLYIGVEGVRDGKKMMGNQEE